MAGGSSPWARAIEDDIIADAIAVKENTVQR
jgi:hypothetical protein